MKFRLVMLMIVVLSLHHGIRIGHFDVTCNPIVDYLELGVSAAQVEQHNEAITYFNCAAEIESTNPSIFFYRGIEYGKLCKYEEAITDYTKVIDLSPATPTYDYYYARAIRASLKNVLGEHKVALDELNAVIELSEQNPDPKSYNGEQGLAFFYGLRSKVRLRLEQYDQAINDLNRAIELYPSLSLAYASRGFIYQKIGNLEQAEQDWQTALEMDEYLVDRYRQSAINDCLGKYFENCIDAVNELMTLTDEPIDSDYLLRGIASFEIGNYDQAIDDLSKALELNDKNTPEDKAPLFYRGRAYLALEEYELALDDFSLYIAANLLFPDTYFYRGEVYKKLNDIDHAKRDYCLYLSLDRENDDHVEAARQSLQAMGEAC